MPEMAPLFASIRLFNLLGRADYMLAITVGFSLVAAPPTILPSSYELPAFVLSLLRVTRGLTWRMRQ